MLTIEQCSGLFMIDLRGANLKQPNGTQPDAGWH